MLVHTKAVDNLVAGMPWQPNVSLTPLPEPGKIDYLKTLVSDAEALGARVMNTGGGQANGTYFHPAVLYPVTTKMRAYQEEQFGPVIPVVAFSDESEVIRYVRESEFGQQLSIFGSDPAAKSSESNRDLVTSIVRERHSRTLTTDYLF